MLIEKLYNEIADLQKEYLRIVEENNGEITKEAEEIEANIEWLLESKYDSADEIFYLKESFDNEIKTLKNIKEQIDNRIKTKERLFENIKRYIANAMIDHNEEKIEGNLCSIKVRKKQDIQIIDKDKIPEEFFIEKVSMVLNERLLIEKLYQEYIEGVKLNKYNTITIYKRGK